MFSVANAYLNPSAPYTPLSSPGAPSGDDPLWVQILYGARQLDSILDRYIFTEQERAEMELARIRAMAELEKARQAGVQVQPATPPWVWVLLALGGVVLVFLLLTRGE